jgi:cobalt-zinc-cadmium resistance protein CzcA
VLSALIRLCVERRLLVLLVTLSVAAYGVRALLATPIEAYPDVTNVQVNVIAQMPGLAPEEIERQVSVPLERALNGTPGMILMRSESLFGLTLLFLTFDDDADTFRARSLVAERVRSATLPDGVVPVLAPEATPLGEIYQYRLTSDRHALDELRAVQDYTVARLIKQVPGVADVVSFGGLLKEIHVEVEPGRLESYGLTLLDVTAALERSNQNVGGGFLKQGEQQLVVRGVGYMQSADDVKNVVLANRVGTPVTVGDVARVVQSYTPRFGTVGEDLEPEIVEGFVLLRRGENPTMVLDGVHAKVEELNQRILPKGMRIKNFYDRTRLVSQTLSTVKHNLLYGFLLIVGVVWLFIRSWRGSVAVAAIIPLSLLVAFTGLRLLGLPANLISMGAIDFGILVDGAVVLVENVIQQARRDRPGSPREMLALVARSAVDVARPTFYAMAIIVAALVPVFTLERVEGRIFRPLALTYSFALAGALAFALTTVPALCALLLRPKDATAPEPKGIEHAREAYRRLIAWLLGHWRLVVAGAAVLAVSGGVTGSRLGTEFLPQLDEGDLVIFVEMPPSVSLEKGQKVLLEVRRRLLAFPEVRGTMSEHGRPEDGTDNEAVNMSETFVSFRPREEWRPGLTKDRMVEAMRASLNEIPGVRFNLSQPIKDNVEEAVSGVRGQIVLKVFGTDLDKMRKALQDAVEVLKPVPGIVDLDLYRDTTVPQLQIQLDRPALARAGLRVGDAQAMVETALSGTLVTEIWERERAIPVRVRLGVAERSDPERIGEIAVPTPGGGRVPLRDVARIRLAEGRASIYREANSRYQALKFNVEGRDVGSVIKDAVEQVDRGVKLPDGHFWVWAGEFENQQRAMRRLGVIVPVALLIVFGLLFAALNSARGAATILGLAPLAMTGGVFALWITGTELSVSAAVGFIALLGQISLAGLLALSAIEARRTTGAGLATAIVEGASDRLRAIVMAGVLAILGLTPMVVASGVGSETQRPFALVIVGGMVTTLLVTLLVLPVCYAWVGPRQPTSKEDAA